MKAISSSFATHGTRGPARPLGRLAGMLAWVVRYALFAFGAPDGVAWMLIGGIVLHGICYDFFFVTGFIYAEKKANPEHRGAVQGFLVLVTQGLGMFIGAKAAGRLVAHYTTTETTADGVISTIAWDKVWLMPALFATGVLVVFFIFFRDKIKATPTDVTEHTPEGETTAETETAI